MRVEIVGMGSKVMRSRRVDIRNMRVWDEVEENVAWFVLNGFS